MAEILTPRCPLCDEEPLWVLGGGTQAFCGNADGRPVLTQASGGASPGVQAGDKPLALTPACAGSRRTPG